MIDTRIQTRYHRSYPDEPPRPSPLLGPAKKTVSETERDFLLAMRQGLLIQLGAIEKLLGLPQSVTPKRKR